MSVNMIHTALEQYGAEVYKAFHGELLFWTFGALDFVTVGTLIWVFRIRKVGERASFKRVFSYLFPKDYYMHPSMKPVYWHKAISLLVLGPLFALLPALFTIFAGEAVNTLLTHHFGARTPSFSRTWVNVTIQVAATALSFSFWSYVAHYAQHKIPLLWSIHRVHHSAETLGLPALWHTHPIEGFLGAPFTGIGSGVMVGVTLYLSGAAGIAPIAKTLLVTHGAWFFILTIFEHSHIPVSFGWFNRIFYAPVLHQIHHSAELRHRDKNLGGWYQLAIWDWLFGTLYIPAKDEEYRWGLNDEELGANNPHLTVRDFYLEPFAYAWGVMKSWRAKPMITTEDAANS